MSEEFKEGIKTEEIASADEVAPIAGEAVGGSETAEEAVNGAAGETVNVAAAAGETVDGAAAAGEAMNSAAAEAKGPKKKKGPEFKSNEYSVWRYIVFLVVGFGGGQLIGSAIAGLLNIIVPVFYKGGILYSVRDSALIILAFVFTFIFAALMIKPILRTTFKSLVTGNRKYKVSFGLVCIAIYIAVAIIFMLISAKNIRYNPADIGTRIAILIFIILFVPFQTTTEELFFRMSLGRLFMKNEVMKSLGKMLLASVISGAIFFFPHLMNPEVRAYGIVPAIFSYFGVGFSLMLISCLVGSFEGAIAVHAINNVWSMAVVSGEVSAASFAPFFIDSTDRPVVLCAQVTVLYGLLIIWAVIFRKKHRLAEE